MSLAKQPYTKPALSFADQARLMIQRGLIADQDELTTFLKHTNYYRFSAYLYPFRQADNNYQPNTAFSYIRRLHDFDQALRAHLFTALTTIEISILRTHFVEFFTLRNGAFGYTHLKNFNMSSDTHEKLLTQINDLVAKSSEEFVAHFREKYSDDYLPLWMVVEAMNFGPIVTMIQKMNNPDKGDFVQRYGVTYSVFDTWLRTLNYVRNCCAHHARMWNRSLAIKPQIPNKRHYPEFHEASFYNTRIFAVLTIIQYLLNIVDPSHTWDSDIKALLARYPDVPTDKMGFPNKWQEMSIWKR